jgi:rhodanese-related sulfurtransferase
MVGHMSPTELKVRLDKGDDIVLLDVREEHELDICKLPYTHHIPLGQLQFKFHEMDGVKDKETIVYCRSGGRSQKAAMFLEDAGFAKVYNLEGGVLAWSDDIDPTMPKY